MSKITLEDCANELYGLEVGLPSNVLCERGATLIRAAQKVVDAASGIRLKATSDGQVVMLGGLELHEALATFRKQEEGE